MELQYQLAQDHPLPVTPALSQLVADDGSRRGSEESDTSLDPGAARFLNERVAVEEGAAQREVGQEIERTRREADEHSDNEQRDMLDQHPQAAAALREAREGSEVEVEDRMPMNAGERQRLRRERLGQKLMDVFGLQEREEVVEEMKCWLLRSVSESKPWCSECDADTGQCSRVTCTSRQSIYAFSPTCLGARRPWSRLARSTSARHGPRSKANFGRCSRMMC